MVAPLARKEEEEGHLGPLQLPGDGSGQLTPEDRQAIKEATGVSAAVRYRDSWGMRMLTLAGPPDNLSEARRMATARLVASQQARPTEAEKLADLTERLGAAELKLTALQHQVSYLVSTSPGMQMYPVATVPHVPAPPAHRHGHRRRRSSASSRKARHRRRASSSPSRSRDRDGSSTSPADRPAKPAELSAEARPAKDELPPGLPMQKVKCEEPDEALEEGRAESKSAEESSSSSPKAAAEAKTAAAKAPSKPAEKLPPRAAPFPTGLGQGGLKRESLCKPHNLSSSLQGRLHCLQSRKRSSKRTRTRRRQLRPRPSVAKRNCSQQSLHPKCANLVRLSHRKEKEHARNPCCRRSN